MFNVATYCAHVEQPPLGYEEGGSKLEQNTENVCMLCFVLFIVACRSKERITVTWMKRQGLARCQMLHKK